MQVSFLLETLPTLITCETLIAHVYLMSAFTSARRIFRMFAHLQYIYRVFLLDVK